MRHVRHGIQGVSALITLNRDRMIATTAIVAAMLVAAWIQSI